MNTIMSWKDQSTYLCSLIKQVSDYYNDEYNQDYVMDIISEYKHNLTEAIECFELLGKQLGKLKRNSVNDEKECPIQAPPLSA